MFYKFNQAAGRVQASESALGAQVKRILFIEIVVRDPFQIMRII